MLAIIPGSYAYDQRTICQFALITDLNLACRLFFILNFLSIFIDGAINPGLIAVRTHGKYGSGFINLAAAVRCVLCLNGIERAALSTENIRHMGIFIGIKKTRTDHILLEIEIQALFFPYAWIITH